MNETRKQTHNTHKHNTNKLGIESIRREEASIFNLTFYNKKKLKRELLQPAMCETSLL